MKQISEYIDQDYLQKPTTKESEFITNRTWYLPAFDIKKLNKDKTRLVYKAATTVNVILATPIC